MVDFMHDEELGRLVDAAKNGDRDAENRIAEHLFPQAIKTAQRKLATMPSPMVDEDDISASALKSLCLGLREGRLEFQGSQELGAALKTIVGRKARKYYRIELAAKRGGGTTRRESELGSNGDESRFGLDKHVAIQSETPHVNDESIANVGQNESEIVGSIVTSLQHDLVGLFKELMNRLNEKTREALLKLMQKDYSNEELAEELGCAVSSVERYRAAIRRKLAGIQAEAEA